MDDDPGSSQPEGSPEQGYPPEVEYQTGFSGDSVPIDPRILSDNLSSPHLPPQGNYPPMFEDYAQADDDVSVQSHDVNDLDTLLEDFEKEHKTLGDSENSTFHNSTDYHNVNDIETPVETIESEDKSLGNGEIYTFQNSTDYSNSIDMQALIEDIERENEKLGDGDDSIFQKAKKEFDAEINPSFQQRIQFKKIENEELQRLNRLKSKRELEIDEEPYKNQTVPSSLSQPEAASFDDYESRIGHEQFPPEAPFQLFCSDDEGLTIPTEPSCDKPSLVENQSNTPPTTAKVTKGGKGTRPKKVNKITAKEKRKAASSGFESLKNKKKKAKPSGVRKKNTGTKAQNRKQSSKKKKPENFNFDSLFSSNLVSKAQENVSKGSIPSFTAKAKGKALDELISSIPLAKQDKGSLLADKRAIMEAIVKFTRRPRADGEGGWRHPDMKTSLYHYQIMGAGFMRDRENSPVAPHGGFLCDEMGFGKTIQAIANMLDGRPGPDSTEESTNLIVVPTHLVSHWKKQIQQHVKDRSLGAILPYHSRERVNTQFLMEMLNNIGVIITTYSEVRSSCPEYKSPASVTKESDCRDWWNKHFFEKCGPLHRIKFRRIILDEAHEIKNHQSKTSIAVRMLTGRFRWVITGTPIHNYAKELFPYFEFLKIPQTGDFQSFCKNYCPDGVLDRSRLANVLRAYMMRRTHEEELFGFPILNLPDINVNTVEVKFNTAERYLYEAVTTHMVKRHLSGASSKNGENQPCCKTGFFPLLTRVRMFTSHLLLSQHPIDFISTPRTIKSLRSSIGNNPSAEELEMCFLLGKLAAKESLPALDEPGPIERSKRNRHQKYPRIQKLVSEFQKRLNPRNSDIAPMKCISCSSLPFDAYITSCLHIYCETCFDPERETCFCSALIEEVSFHPIVQSLWPIELGTPKEADSIECNSTDELPITEEEGPEENDEKWSITAGHLMPGAKLTAVKRFVTNWINESPRTKVTIFTQFRAMVDILSFMCQKEGWGYITLTGRTSPLDRDSNIESFRNNPNLRVLISSLKAGGTGLDLTMSQKCILVDLWWNDAIETQAFCRLFRIGQTSDVEIVRITVKDTIDDRIQNLQRDKAADIERTMGLEVLAGRETLEDILKMFGVGEYEQDGPGFVVSEEA